MSYQEPKSKTINPPQSPYLLRSIGSLRRQGDESHKIITDLSLMFRQKKYIIFLTRGEWNERKIPK